jgi:SAM-dependent methyltransferase
MSKRELMIGCGNQRKRRVTIEGLGDFENLVTLDIDPSTGADLIHDLNILPWPFADNEFDEIHAYEVLEHLGKQGDFASFFAHFSEIWRILKPDGMLFASVPMWDSPWAWGDPGHTRLIPKESLIFLDQRNYVQVGKTPCTDYRGIYKADLQPIWIDETEHALSFVLKANK